MYSEENFKNIILILSEEVGSKPEQVLKKPLSAVRDIKIQGLDETINENIEQFIRHFILISEDFDSIPELLNNEDVGFPLLSEITRQMGFFVDDIKKVNNRTGINPEKNDINTETSLYELLLKYGRISPTWDNVFCLAQKEDEDKNLSPELAIWFDRNLGRFEAPLFPLMPEYSDLIFAKLFNSNAMSDEGRNAILRLCGFPYSDLPEYMHFESTRSLIAQKLLLSTKENFDAVRQRFADDVDEDELTPLLAGLIFQNPSLLQDPAKVMITDDGFDRLLAEQLFAHGLLPDKVQARLLEWMWSYDIKLFDDLLFLSPVRLAQLAPHVADEGIRLALFIRLLDTGILNHQDIVQIIRTFTDENLLAFISDKEYRRIGYSDSLWELASLLEAAGFIRRLKWDEKYKRIRFVPHNRSVSMTE